MGGGEGKERYMEREAWWGKGREHSFPHQLQQCARHLLCFWYHSPPLQLILILTITLF